MARHIRIVLIVLSLLAPALVACGDEARTAGELKDFATVCDKANEGKRMAVEGFLRFPDSFTQSTYVVLRMYETDAAEGKPIGVSTDIGTKANQVEKVEDKFTDEDLKAHLSDGATVVDYLTKVRASGKVYYPSAGIDFECGLDNVLLEAAE